MNISRFCAPDMRQAIRMVRETLGPDAVIISNRKIDEGIEIIAAIDYDESLLPGIQSVSSNTDIERPANEIKEEMASTQQNEVIADVDLQELQTASVSEASEAAIKDVKNEINELRELLEKQLAHFAWGEMKHRQPVHTELLCRLEQLGIDRTLIDSLADVVSHAEDDKHAWQLAMTELSNQLHVVEEDMVDAGGVIALVGSTGVGKTTTIAKLASRYVLRYGQRHVALVTTDCYRIGAHDQLMTFGRILGVPVQIASDKDELRSILRSLSDKRLVLIDTAGMSQRDIRLHDQLTTLADSGVPVSTLLVLSATAQRSLLDETVSAFSSTSLAGTIVTKVDETTSLGGLLSVLIRKKLPLAFIANGQRVPEDLHLARAKDLVERAANLSKSQSLPEESAMAELYGEVKADAVI